jgi:hypothetical protein
MGEPGRIILPHHAHFIIILLKHSGQYPGVAFFGSEKEISSPQTEKLYFSCHLKECPHSLETTDFDPSSNIDTSFKVKIINKFKHILAFLSIPEFA